MLKSKVLDFVHEKRFVLSERRKFLKDLGICCISTLLVRADQFCVDPCLCKGVESG